MRSTSARSIERSVSGHGSAPAAGSAELFVPAPPPSASSAALEPVGLPTIAARRPLPPRVPPPALSCSGRAIWRKRVFDAIGATALLLLLSPVLVATALAVRLSGAGPAIYRQRRIGRRGEPFEIWKFRTMTVGAEKMVMDLTHRNHADGLLFKVRDDPRVTQVGRVLRRLSIDELPQLVNVLRGEMSLVGPRPLAVDPDLFDDEAKLRHTVRPGITGAWQVAGGNALPYREMIRLDLAYIEEWSLLLDIRLLVRTVRVAFGQHGPW